MKTYHEYHGLSLDAEKKLRTAESQKLKVEQHTKGTMSRKFKNFEKQTEKVSVLGAANDWKMLYLFVGYIKSADH